MHGIGVIIKVLAACDRGLAGADGRLRVADRLRQMPQSWRPRPRSCRYMRSCTMKLRTDAGIEARFPGYDYRLHRVEAGEAPDLIGRGVCGRRRRNGLAARLELLARKQGMERGPGRARRRDSFRRRPPYRLWPRPCGPANSSPWPGSGAVGGLAHCNEAASARAGFLR